MLDYSPNGQNEFVRDVGGLNRADFKKTGGAITYPTEHGTLAILVTKEVYELGPQNGRAVTGDGPAVSIPGFEELTLFARILLVKIIEDYVQQFVTIGSLVPICV